MEPVVDPLSVGVGGDVNAVVESKQPLLGVVHGRHGFAQ